MQVRAALQFLVLDDDEIIGEINVVAPFEEALVLPTPRVGIEHDRQVLDALVAEHAQFLDGPRLESIAQAGDAQFVAVFPPELENHGRDRLVLDFFQGVLHRAHLGDTRHQHVDVFVDVDDVGERIEADVDVGSKLDIRTLGFAAQFLEAAAEVEHPDLGAYCAVGPGHLVHQHGFA